LIVRGLPSGSIKFYAETGRGNRELIWHGDPIKDTDIPAIRPGTPVEADHVVKSKVTLPWVRKECLKIQGKVLNGTDFVAERRRAKALPTLDEFMGFASLSIDVSYANAKVLGQRLPEGSYGWWLLNNRRNGGGISMRCSRE